MTPDHHVAHNIMKNLASGGILSVVGLASDHGLSFRSMAICFRFKEDEPRLSIMSAAAVNSILTALFDEARAAGAPVAVWKSIPAWSDDPVEGEPEMTRRLLSARVAFISPDELHRRLTEPDQTLTAGALE